LGKKSCINALFGATRLLDFVKFSYLHNYLDLHIYFQRFARGEIGGIRSKFWQQTGEGSTASSEVPTNFVRILQNGEPSHVKVPHYWLWLYFEDFSPTYLQLLSNIFLPARLLDLPKNILPTRLFGTTRLIWNTGVAQQQLIAGLWALFKY